MGAAGSVLDRENDEYYDNSGKSKVTIETATESQKSSFNSSIKSDALSARHPFQSPIVSRANSTKFPTLQSTKPSSGTFAIDNTSPEYAKRFDYVDGLSEKDAFEMMQQKLENFVIQKENTEMITTSMSSRNPLADLLVVPKERHGEH